MKKWLVRGGLVVLCGIVVLVILHVRGRMALRQKIAELKAQGLPTTFAELEAQSRLPEGTPNAADIYMQAFAAYRPLADAEKQKLLPVMGERPEPEANEPYPQEQMDAAREFVEQNQEMFRLLHEAGQVKECVYPMNISKGLISLGDAYDGIRNGRTALSIASRYYADANQPEKAFLALIDQLHLADSLSHSNILVARLLQAGIIDHSMPGLSRYLNHCTFEDVQLLGMQAALEGSSKKMIFDTAMQGEICTYIDYGKKPYRNVFDVPQQALLSVYAKCMFMKNIIKVIEFHQQLLAIEQMPIKEQLEYSKAIDSEVSYLSWHYYALAKIITPELGRCYLIHLRVRATMGCAITALAIERYRMKEGALPETVEALVPEYLPAVYVDPFDGKPLRYKREGAGYIVYTIGHDGVDDGGREQDPDNPKETYDWVFRVGRE